MFSMQNYFVIPNETITNSFPESFKTISTRRKTRSKLISRHFAVPFKKSDV